MKKDGTRRIRMTHPGHDDWNQFHSFVLELHRATDAETLCHVLAFGLRRLFGTPCEVAIGPERLSGPATADNKEIHVAGFVLHLPEPPDESRQHLLHCLLDHLRLAVSRIRGQRPQTSPPPKSPILSPRQQEVLALLLRGCSNSEIAYELRISIRTVEKHVTAILRAHGVAGRVQLLANHSLNSKKYHQ